MRGRKNIQLKFKILILLVISVAISFLFIPKAKAAEKQDIIISGFAITDGGLIIELFNASKDEISLSEKQINFYFPENQIFSSKLFFQASSSIEPHKYFLIGSDLADAIYNPPDLNIRDLFSFEISGIGTISRGNQLKNSLYFEQILDNYYYHIDVTNLSGSVDSTSYLVSEFNLENLNNSLSQPVPAYPILNSLEPYFSPQAGYLQTQFNFFVNYTSYKNSPPSELNMVFLSSERGLVDSNCTLSEVNTQDNIFYDGKDYKFTCQLPDGQLEYSFETVDSEGIKAPSFSFIKGPNVKEQIIEIKLPEELKGEQEISWTANLSNYISNVFISEDDLNWTKLYTGSDNKFVLKTYDYKNGQSYIKVSLSDPTTKEELLFHEVPTKINNYQAISGDLIFSEILPNPTKESPEWFEIYNTRDFSITGNFYVKDNYSTDKIFFTIKPKEYLVVAANTAQFKNTFPLFSGNLIKIIDGRIGNGLANSKDELTLLNFSKEKLDSISYNFDFKTNQSFALIDNTWRTTFNITPGLANLSVEKIFKSETVDNSVDEETQPSDKVILTGYVTALPNVLSSQYFYIENNDLAVQVYNYNKEFPSLKLGQLVMVKGDFNKSLNRLKVSDPKDVEIQAEIKNLFPNEADVGNLSSQLGHLIKTTSKLREKSAKTLKLENGLIIYLKSSDFKLSNFLLGSTWQFVGILEKFGDEYRLCPRDLFDVELTQSFSREINQKPKTQSVNRQSKIQNPNPKNELIPKVKAASTEEKPIVADLESNLVTGSKYHNQISSIVTLALVILLLASIYYIRSLIFKDGKDNKIRGRNN